MANQSPPLSDGQSTVLLCDDDRNFRLLARKALERSGFYVVEAENGLQVLETFDQESPDIILLDIKMPEMDGFTACSTIRKKPGGERIPILLVTGLEDYESIEEAYKVGATDFITKPVNWSLLGQRVRFMLRANQFILKAMEEDIKSQYSLGTIPPMMGENEDDPPIDADVLKNILELEATEGVNILKEVVQTFLDDSPKIIQDIKTAFSQQKIDIVQMMAIRMVSMATHFGAHRLTSLCKELDNVCRNNHLEYVDDIVQDIEKECLRVSTALRDELKGNSLFQV